MGMMSDYPKRRVLFKGPLAEVSLVGSVTKIKYGRHKDGDILWVHTLDAQAEPERFVAPPQEETVEDLPKAPEDVRRMLVPPVPDSFVEEEVPQGLVEVEGRPTKRVVAKSRAKPRKKAVEQTTVEPPIIEVEPEDDDEEEA
jgi:hypothetical protein